MQRNFKKKVSPKTKRFLTAILALTILALFINSVSAHTITVPTNTYFGLPEYLTYISFNPATTLNTAYRQNNYWYFNGYGFQTQNANMTITNFFQSNKLKFTLKASTGTSTTKIYLPARAPSTVTAISGTITSWNFNDTTSLLTIVAEHSSDVIVEATFYPMFETHASSASASIIAYGTGFNLYFPATTKLAFQHLDIPYTTKGATVTLTVTSGTLNGTSGTLTMYRTSGTLRFTNLNTSTITLTSTDDKTTFQINGKTASSATITLGSTTISWAIPQFSYLNYTTLFMGIGGVIMMIFSPMWLIKKVKDEGFLEVETIERFGYCFLIFLIGFGLVIMWLWG